VVSAVFKPGISFSWIPDKLWFRSRKAARIVSRGVAAEGKSVARSALMAKASKTKSFDESVIDLDARPSVGRYIEAAKQQRVWAREARLLESGA
jgi:hypothetical protein